ncbi:hypothetical protein BJ912DRAFT_868623, partial [Pholiota molesta]
FGVCKRRFKLMAAAAEYDLRTQAKVPGAIAALHNFIRIHDPDDLAREDSDDSDSESEGIPNQPEIPITPETLGGHISQAEKNRANAKRDQIARAMWEDYVEELQRRSMV